MLSTVINWALLPPEHLPGARSTNVTDYLPHVVLSFSLCREKKQKVLTPAGHIGSHHKCSCSLMELCWAPQVPALCFSASKRSKQLLFSLCYSKIYLTTRMRAVLLLCVHKLSLTLLSHLAVYGKITGISTATSHQQMPNQRRHPLRQWMLQWPLDLWTHSLHFKIFMLGHYFMLSCLIEPMLRLARDSYSTCLMEPMLRLARESYLHYANYWYLPLLVL